MAFEAIHFSVKSVSLLCLKARNYHGQTEQFLGPLDNSDKLSNCKKLSSFFKLLVVEIVNGMVRLVRLCLLLSRLVTMWEIVYFFDFPLACVSVRRLYGNTRWWGISSTWLMFSLFWIASDFWNESFVVCDARGINKIQSCLQFKWKGKTTSDFLDCNSLSYTAEFAAENSENQLPLINGFRRLHKM